MMIHAAAVASAWSPAVDGLFGGDSVETAVTIEMLSTATDFLDTFRETTDDEELAATAGRIEAVLGSQDLVGMSVGSVIDRVVRAAEPKALSDDSSSRLSPAQRGIATEGETLLIPASAHAAGALGTRWRTDLVLTSVGGIDAQVIVALLPRDQPNPAPEELRLLVEDGRSVVLEDALKSLFDFSGAAALRLDCETGTVIVTSRTYNLEGALGSPSAQTFGQLVPALSADDAIMYGDQGRLLLLGHDPSLTRAQRTNLILVNGGDQNIAVSVGLHTSNGALLGTVTRSLRAWEYLQVDRVFEEVTSAVVDDGFAVVRVETSGGRVFALASVVDNLTGDPVAVPAVLRSPVDERVLFDTQFIQAAAKVAGAAGTDWRSDLVLHDLTGVGPSVSVKLLPRGQENTDPVEELLWIPPGSSLRYDDVLETLFDTDGAAALRIKPSFGPVAVSSRIYNVLAEDNPDGYPAGATFGQYMGPVGFSQSFGFGEEAWIQHLSHDPSLSSGFRSNLGLVNNSTVAIELEVELYRGDGTHLGSFPVSLRQWENVQIAKVFERVTDQPVIGGYAVVRTTNPAGFFAAHGSVVDNRTGDPVTVDAVGARRPAPAGPVASGDMLMQVFEAGLAPRQVFEFLRGGTLAGYFDQIASGIPDRVVRTADGIVFDLGAGTEVGATIFASGRVGLADATVTDGETVTGSITIDFDQTAVDGLAPVVEDLELGLDLTRVGGDHVAGTVTLGSTGLAKNVSQLGGSLEFDTRLCEMYPIGGSITVMYAGEERTLVFNDRCDGSFRAEFPSARYYSLGMYLNDCQGGMASTPQDIHLIDEGGRLAVDPSSPPGLTGRRRFSATGRVTYLEASVRFAQKAGAGSVGERRTGGFQGLQNAGGSYYTGTYGYDVSEGDCRSSFYHGRDDQNFSPGILTECDGPCAE